MCVVSFLELRCLGEGLVECAESVLDGLSEFAFLL